MGGADDSGLSRVSLYGAARALPWLSLGAVISSIVPSASHLGVGFPVIVGSGDSIITWSTLAPYLLALGFAWALAARRTHLSEHAVRRIGLRDAAVLLALNLSVLVITLATPGRDLAVPRNTAFLTGLTAIALALASPAAAGALLTGVMLVMLTYGPSAPWAHYVRIVQGPPSLPTSLAAALSALIIGALCLATDIGLSSPRLWTRWLSPTRTSRRSRHTPRGVMRPRPRWIRRRR